MIRALLLNALTAIVDNLRDLKLLDIEEAYNKQVNKGI
jgi:hypothetical protein